ncbi:MAG: phosphotransferase [Actinomycetota bacterium]
MTDRDDHRVFVEERWPDLAVVSFEPLGYGWDCFTYLVNGEWVFQFPRLPGAGERLRKQIEVLPDLAREVSSAVPAPTYASLDPPCMGYLRIEGTPMSTEVDGIWPERLGRFLYDLHLTPPEFVGMRSSTGSAVREGLRFEVASLSDHVLPLLEADERTHAEQTLATFLEDDENFRFAPCLTHGDIGPEHVLVTGTGDLAGVIDWGDAEVGDPVCDLAWVVHAMPVEGERVLGAYGGPPDDRFFVRARFAFLLMPWHEVKYGAQTGQEAFVRSGLAGVRERLRRADRFDVPLPDWHDGRSNPDRRRSRDG